MLKVFFYRFFAILWPRVLEEDPAYVLRFTRMGTDGHSSCVVSRIFKVKSDRCLKNPQTV